MVTVGVQPRQLMVDLNETDRRDRPVLLLASGEPDLVALALSGPRVRPVLQRRGRVYDPGPEGVHRHLPPPRRHLLLHLVPARPQALRRPRHRRRPTGPSGTPAARSSRRNARFSVTRLTTQVVGEAPSPAVGDKEALLRRRHVQRHPHALVTNPDPAIPGVCRHGVTIKGTGTRLTVLPKTSSSHGSRRPSIPQRLLAADVLGPHRRPPPKCSARRGDRPPRLLVGMGESRLGTAAVWREPTWAGFGGVGAGGSGRDGPLRPALAGGVGRVERSERPGRRGGASRLRARRVRPRPCPDSPSWSSNHRSRPRTKPLSQVIVPRCSGAPPPPPGGPPARPGG